MRAKITRAKIISRLTFVRLDFSITRACFIVPATHGCNQENYKLILRSDCEEIVWNPILIKYLYLISPRLGMNPAPVWLPPPFMAETTKAGLLAPC